MLLLVLLLLLLILLLLLLRQLRPVRRGGYQGARSNQRILNHAHLKANTNPKLILNSIPHTTRPPSFDQAQGFRITLSKLGKLTRLQGL